MQHEPRRQSDQREAERIGEPPCRDSVGETVSGEDPGELGEPDDGGERPADGAVDEVPDRPVAAITTDWACAAPSADSTGTPATAAPMASRMPNAAPETNPLAMTPTGVPISATAAMIFAVRRVLGSRSWPER